MSECQDQVICWVLICMKGVQTLGDDLAVLARFIIQRLQAREIIHREAGAYTRRLLSAITESGLDAQYWPASSYSASTVSSVSGSTFPTRIVEYRRGSANRPIQMSTRQMT